VVLPWWKGVGNVWIATTSWSRTPAAIEPRTTRLATSPPKPVRTGSVAARAAGRATLAGAEATAGSTFPSGPASLAGPPSGASALSGALLMRSPPSGIPRVGRQERPRAQNPERASHPATGSNARRPRRWYKPPNGRTPPRTPPATYRRARCDRVGRNG